MPSEQVVKTTMENGGDNIVISFGAEKSADETKSLFKAGVRDIFVEPFMPEELIDLAFSIKKESKEEKISAASDNVKPEEKRNKSNAPIGVSQIFKSLLMLVERVADSDATVMISGESGTGKEVLSQYVHLLSNRKDKPFVPVNCGAIPENLLESELFGHVKGAFTGAFTDRKGRFEVAANGTIFLDEIGELPLHLQVKLLRVLQEKEIQPVGSNEIIKINSRVITATNRDLEEEVRRGRFREDLFYRLNIIPIHIPPLRKRLDDIPLLASHFINKFNERHHKNIEGITEETLQKLMGYTWPGNIRELENTIERMIVIRSEGKLGVEDLPPKILGIEGDAISFLLGIEKAPEPKVEPSLSASIQNPFSIDWEHIEIPDNFDVKQFLDDIETGLIKNVMGKTGNNKNQAALQLGVNRTTLIEKIKKKNLNI